MLGQKCIIFRGKRLAGNLACLFDGSPRTLKKMVNTRGVAMPCNKFKYPPPHDCIPLVPEGGIIAEIPFQPVVGLYQHFYDSLISAENDTPDKAWDDMLSRGFTVVDDPLAEVFQFTSVWNVQQVVPNVYRAGGQWNMQNMFVPVDALDPAWLADDDIDFSLSFTAPVVPDVPDFLKLAFLNRVVDFNSGLFEMSVEKAIFYGVDYKILFFLQPEIFGYDDYLDLPVNPFSGSRGVSFADLAAFGLKLVVHRDAQTFKACWPTDVFNDAKIVSLVHGPSRLVVGPPIKTKWEVISDEN